MNEFHWDRGVGSGPTSEQYDFCRGGRKVVSTVVQVAWFLDRGKMMTRPLGV